MFWYFDDSLSLSSKPFMLALFTICTSIGVSSPSSARKPCHSRHTRHVHDRRQVDINTMAGWLQCHVQLESIYSQAQRRTSTSQPDALPAAQPTASKHWRKTQYDKSHQNSLQHSTITAKYWQQVTYKPSLTPPPKNSTTHVCTGISVICEYAIAAYCAFFSKVGI